MGLAGQPVRVYYVSAAEDGRWRGRLVKHLAPLRREGLLIELPEKTSEDEQVLEDQLAQADLILLLLSADFFAASSAMQLAELALARHVAGKVLLVPVRLHPVDYALSPISKLQALPASGEPISNARKPDKVLAQVARVLRSIVDGMAGVALSDKVSDAPELPGPQGAFSGGRWAVPVWNVPLARNPFFCGQDELLEQLHTRLQVERALPQAICGLGGWAKTQVASEYAYRYRAEYQAVLWVQAATHEALMVGFAELAQLLQLAGSNAQDQMVAVQAVMRWLASQRGWLLILDNADELSVVRAFLPASGQGNVLLTTRTQAFGLLAEGREVPRLGEQEGALFLLRRARVLDREQGLESVTLGECKAAFEVVAMMDGLPLALDQAGAYIEETQTDILHYAELFRAQRTQLLKRRGAMATHTTEHPQPVATTLTLSFERVELVNPTADLLRGCAFLHPNTIPETLFTEGTSATGASMLGSTHDPVALDEAVQTLRSYSLIHRDPATRTLSYTVWCRQ